jgi:hypothetical protein
MLNSKVSIFSAILLILLTQVYNFLIPRELIAQTSPTLTRSNNTFYLNGFAVSRFGLRAANALRTDAITQDFINKLDGIKSHGMQSVSISLQGGNFGEPTNAFNADGTLKSEYKTRITTVMNAIAARNMVSVVSFYYQQRDQELTSPTHTAAVIKAAEESTNFLKPWRNAWFYVINEPFHSGLSDYLRSASGQSAIYNTIKNIDSARIIYVSDTSNDGFTSKTGVSASNGNVIVEYQRKDEYPAPGVFDPGELEEAQTRAELTMNNGGYWFWHAAWHQKANVAGFPRFDKGGVGTASDPGVSPIWDKMQSLSGGATSTPNPTILPTNTPKPPTATPTPYGPSADANGDGIIDGRDLAIWITNYGKNLSETSNGDFDKNNTVNLADYRIWINTY